MPCRSADWRRAHPDFDQKYARAKDDGWDVFAEKLVERSVDVPPELAQSRRLEVDTGKWLLSKLAARRYGDRLEVKSEISGPNGGPLQVEMLLNVLLTPANLERLSDIEVQSIRSAAAKLALPAPGPVIEGVIAESAAGVAVGRAGDAAGVFDGLWLVTRRARNEALYGLARSVASVRVSLKRVRGPWCAVPLLHPGWALACRGAW
jgi:hypothetical protein